MSRLKLVPKEWDFQQAVFAAVQKSIGGNKFSLGEMSEQIVKTIYPKHTADDKDDQYFWIVTKEPHAE